jgi:hypothetical protein
MLKSIYCYNFVGSTFMKRNIWVLKNPCVKVQNSTQLAHSWWLVNALTFLSFTEICFYCTLQAWIGLFKGLVIICIMQLSLAEYWQIACDYMTPALCSSATLYPNLVKIVQSNLSKLCISRHNVHVEGLLALCKSWQPKTPPCYKARLKTETK